MSEIDPTDANGVTLAVEVAEARLPMAAPELEALFTRALVACGFEGRVSLAVIDDAAMRRINRDYHDCDEPTDVLAFPLDDLGQGDTGSGESGPGDAAIGDTAIGDTAIGDTAIPGAFRAEIVVSLETAERESAARGVTTASELLLYVVHGTLHMLGYDDHDSEDARKMHARTLEILAELGYENTIGVDL